MKYPRMTCLNGYWDFKPIYDTEPAETIAKTPPEEGWVSDTYIVPSIWNRPRNAVRKKGERYYHSIKNYDVSDEHEFLFDAYRYPLDWSKTRRAWVKRSLDIPEKKAGTRYILRFEGIMPRSHIFVNGTKMIENLDPTMPTEIDATDSLKSGTNQIALFIDTQIATDKGRYLTPTGNVFTTGNSGIWQDVYLIERPEVYLEDLTIVTSVRNKTISIRSTIRNESDSKKNCSIDYSALEWKKDTPWEKLPVEKDFPSQTVSVESHGLATVETTADWPDARLWSPDAPNLYVLRSTLHTEGHQDDISLERFGFREVWIDGPKLLLNGYPLHLGSDWGHKVTPFWMTEGWIRKWFGMLKDANMNHSRLHAFPHPPIILDIADEMGMFLTGEAGMHGAEKHQASEDPRYWPNVHTHFHRFVRRDKNHPSLILWSVENEMRWNEDIGGTHCNDSTLMRQELAKCRTLVKELDPTRPVYHDGDSSLWNETKQEIISRHYGKGCAGIGWWKKDKPLLSTEMTWIHQMGPTVTLHLGGDKTYADYSHCDDAAGLEAELLIESGRANGVSCFGPWNLSCMANLRPVPEAVELHYDDLSSPGIKPLYVQPYAAEFRFWEEGKGYQPHNTFRRIAHAFRPLAVIDRSMRNQYFAGAELKRELWVVNDTDGDVSGTLQAKVHSDDATIIEQSWDISLDRGERTAVNLEKALPDLPAGTYHYTATFTANGSVLDTWDRNLRIAKKNALPDSLKEALTSVTVGVFDSEPVMKLFQENGIKASAVKDLTAESLRDITVLIVGSSSIKSGTSQNQDILRYVRAGGRALVLDQRYSLFPQIELEEKPILHAWMRAIEHPALEGFTNEDFFAWGESPYPATASDAYVAYKMYRKSSLKSMLPLLDSGDGKWGFGDLDYTPLFEHTDGDGLVVACQLYLVQKVDTVSAADRLFWSLLQRVVTWNPPQPVAPLLVDGNNETGIKQAIDTAASGTPVIVNGITQQTAKAWSEALGVSLAFRDTGDTYQAVRKQEDPVLSGISNHDTCAIETYLYAGGPSVENFEIGKNFFAPSEHIEPLLVTPTRSLLREMMVYNGCTELMLGYTASRFLNEGAGDEAVVLGRVKVGSGSILLNQFAPPVEKRLRFQRLLNRLRANLGETLEEPLLEGNSTSALPAKGPGYLDTMHRLDAKSTAELEQEMIESTQRTGEEPPCKAILNIPGFTKDSSENGVFSAGDLADYDSVYLFCDLMCAGIRMMPEGKEQDPDLLTNLHCQGEGTVDLWLDGKHRGNVQIDNETRVIEDVPVDHRFNQVLVRWKPKSKDSTLKATWKNNHGITETEFTFRTFY